MPWSFNPHGGKTINRRAVCGRSARTVRREGGPNPIGPPYPYQERWLQVFPSHVGASFQLALPRQDGNLVATRHTGIRSSTGSDPEAMISSGFVEGFNGKAKLTGRKAYGLRTPQGIEIAMFHPTGYPYPSRHYSTVSAKEVKDASAARVCRPTRTSSCRVSRSRRCRHHRRQPCGP